MPIQNLEDFFIKILIEILRFYNFVSLNIKINKGVPIASQQIKLCAVVKYFDILFITDYKHFDG